MNRWHGHARIDVDAELLDRQVVDPDGRAVGKVDDVELRRGPDGGLEITAIVVGSAALLDRTTGWIRWVLRWTQRLGGGPDEPRRIGVEEIVDLTSAVVVTAEAAHAAVSPSELRVRRILRRLPGADDESE